MNECPKCGSSNLDVNDSNGCCSDGTVYDFWSGDVIQADRSEGPMKLRCMSCLTDLVEETVAHDCVGYGVLCQACLPGEIRKGNVPDSAGDNQ